MNVAWILGLNVDIPLWVLLALGIPLVLIVTYYWYMTWHNDIFKQLGIPGPKPTPILGTLKGTFEGGFAGHDDNLVAKYGEIVGAFMGRQPFIVVADLAIIRQVLVKQFNKFVDRIDFSFDGEIDGNMIQLVQEKKWRNLRNSLSPAFSTGKLKKMSKLISDCADQMVQNLKEPAQQQTIVDLKEYAGAYTMDTIARTAFGLHLNSKKDGEDKFVVMANESMNSSLASPIFIILFFFRFLAAHMHKIGLSTFPKKGSTFFKGIVLQLIEERKKNPGKYTDFIQLMLESGQDKADDSGDEEEKLHGHDDKQHIPGKKKPLSESEIVASSVVFFLAGYETTGNTLMFVLHSLATHQHIQDKLYQDIQTEVQGKQPEYADLPKLPYLEQIIEETLRKYPQLPRIDRIANQEVNIEGLRIPKGMQVSIPVQNLHNNPKYWKEPEKFEPDRFRPEEKAKRDPYCYLPFGLGPRNCIGMRLALVELKLGIIKLLQNYEFKTCSKTQENLKQMKMRAAPDGGVYLTLCNRNQ